MRGYDKDLRAHVQTEVGRALADHNAATVAYITDLVNDLLDRTRQTMPDGVTISPPTLDRVDLRWNDFGIPIDFSDLPLQEAVNFVSAMVMAQASKSEIRRRSCHRWRPHPHWYRDQGGRIRSPQ